MVDFRAIDCAKEVDISQFCDQMASLGVHILFLLLNTKACTAKMDQLFEKFKPACTKSALCVALCKMQQRMMVRVESANQLVSLLDGSNNDSNEVDPIVDDGPGKHREQSIYNLSFQIWTLGIWSMVGRTIQWNCSHLITTLTPADH
jgi:hypothetical protein